MGRISCFSIEGIQCWFNSQEIGHQAHFHAKRAGKWECRVYFQQTETEMLEIKWKKERISRQDRNILHEKASEFRSGLLKEWEEKVKYAD